MLAFNPKTESNNAGDQATLSLVMAVCKQARPFYQRTAPLISDNNIRRYFHELELLHQQAFSLNNADGIKATSDADINAVCQWYRCENAGKADDKNEWLAELPQQLHRQLTAFKRLNRELTQRDNARALANLTAGLQIVSDQLSPLLSGK